MNRGFVQLVKKETLHIFRDVRTMTIVLLIPAVLMTLFGFAISTDINNVNVAVVAPARTHGIYEAVDKLSNNTYVTFKGFASHDEALKWMREGKVDAIVEFATDYERSVQQQNQGIPTKPYLLFQMDASNTNMSVTSSAYLKNILSPTNSQSSLFETHLLFNPQMKSSYNFVTGVMGFIFILICAMMTSVSIVREKELGTMEVLLVSPVRPLVIIFAKMVPYLVISLFNLATALLISSFVLNVPMSGNILNVIFISMLYLFLSLGLGMLISTLVKSQMEAMLLSAVSMLIPVIMFSGMVFPIENMPIILQYFSSIIPARWYIEGIRKLMIEGLPLNGILLELSIIVLMIIPIIIIALKRFNDKLE